MKYRLRIRFKKVVTKFAVILILLLSLMIFPCSASTISTSSIGVYLGTSIGDFIPEVYDYEVQAWVYYLQDTSQILEIDSMVVRVYNYGKYAIDQTMFYACDGNEEKNTTAFSDFGNEAILKGETGRSEVDWLSYCQSQGYDAIYQKNGFSDNPAAITQLSAGNNELNHAGLLCYWHPSSRRVIEIS